MMARVMTQVTPGLVTIRRLYSLCDNYSTVPLSGKQQQEGVCGCSNKTLFTKMEGLNMTQFAGV